MDRRATMAEHEKVLEIIRMKDAGMPLALDPHRSALLIVDVQRHFVRPENPFGQVLEALVPGVTAGYFARPADGHPEHSAPAGVLPRPAAAHLLHRGR